MTGASTLRELLVALGIVPQEHMALPPCQVYLRLDCFAADRIEADITAVDKFSDAHRQLAGPHHGPADFSGVAVGRDPRAALRS